MHFDFDDPITLTGFTASAFDIEGKTSGRIAARFGFGQTCKPFADRGKGTGIGGGVGAGRATDGGLVNINHLIEQF